MNKIKEQLLSEYKYRVESHAHTNPASKCSEVSPKKLVEIYSDLGYDAIVITNHFIRNYSFFENNSVEDGLKLYFEEFCETVKAAENKNIKVLLGAEIRFTENINDYLVYGVDEKMLREIYDFLPYGVENFRKNYKMPNSVFLQAHPFRDGMTEVDPKLLDGIETLNLHQGHNSRIAIATRYAANNNFDIVSAGSDFHHLGRGHEGATAILTKTLPKDSFEFAQILKSGDYLFEIGGQAIVLP